MKDRHLRSPIYISDVHSRGSVAQLVRAPHCHCGGRGFESRRVRQIEGRATFTVREAYDRILAELERYHFICSVTVHPETKKCDTDCSIDQ